MMLWRASLTLTQTVMTIIFILKSKSNAKRDKNKKNTWQFAWILNVSLNCMQGGVRERLRIYVTAEKWNFFSLYSLYVREFAQVAFTLQDREMWLIDLRMKFDLNLLAISEVVIWGFKNQKSKVTKWISCKFSNCCKVKMRKTSSRQLWSFDIKPRQMTHKLIHSFLLVSSQNSSTFLKFQGLTTIFFLSVMPWKFLSQLASATRGNLGSDQCCFRYVKSSIHDSLSGWCWKAPASHEVKWW